MTGAHVTFDGDGFVPRVAAARDHPLPSVVPLEVRPYQGMRAGIVSRLLANTIDFGVLAIALAALYLGINAVRFLWNARNFHFSSVDRPVAFVVAGVVLAAYLTLAWALVGCTVGDRVLGLRVVGRGGGPIHLVVAAARAVICVVFPIGILWVAVSPADRSVADVILRTSVCYDW